MVLVGCASSRHTIYKQDNVYSYEVFVINADADTIANCSLQMKMQGKSVFGKSTLRYDYGKCQNQPAYYEITSYEDNENHIDLHPPRMGLLSFTSILPYPTYHYPLGCVASIKGETYFEKSTFTSATGKTISYKSEQQGEETLHHNGKEIKCYLVNGENTSHIEELGQYKVKYYFNPDLGFVKWEYTLPNKERIILELK